MSLESYCFLVNLSQMYQEEVLTVCLAVFRLHIL